MMPGDRLEKLQLLLERSPHDARASRDGLAIRSRYGTRTGLSQRFVMWGLANPWRLPALHCLSGIKG